MKTEQLMTKLVATCHPKDSLATAARMMWDRDVGFLPVIEADGHLVGAVTDRDIAMGAFVDGGTLGQIPVHQVMAKDIVSCRGGTEVTEAAELMKRAQVHRIPVVDEHKRLIGVLSLNDLAIAAANPQLRDGVKTGDSVKPAEVASTLAAICAHRNVLHQPGAPSAQRKSPEARA